MTDLPRPNMVNERDGYIRWTIGNVAGGSDYATTTDSGPVYVLFCPRCFDEREI